MAGMTGFIHSCSETKVQKNKYRCALRDSDFSDSECNLIWDFYVARSFAATTGDPIFLDTYGWQTTQSNTDGLPALENQLAVAAGISSLCIVRNKTIKDTLSQMDLGQERLCVTHTRAVLMQNFSYEATENETVTIKSEESRINAIFRHIRNSFAHGNTFFFPNDMCLLEDKDGKKVTAAILIPKQVLLDWIYIVDKNHFHYKP